MTPVRATGSLFLVLAGLLMGFLGGGAIVLGAIWGYWVNLIIGLPLTLSFVAASGACLYCAKRLLFSNARR